MFGYSTGVSVYSCNNHNILEVAGGGEVGGGGGVTCNVLVGVCFSEELLAIIIILFHSFINFGSS